MKNFTLLELLIVVFCVGVLAMLTIGMTPREDAREKVCADRVRRLLKVSHLYAADHRGMWMSPCNLPSGAWVKPLVSGKYLKTPWNKLMSSRESEITCPELPRVAKYKVIQGYGGVYNNGSSYDPQVGLYIYSPEYSFAKVDGRRVPVEWSKRIWFADSLNILKPPYPSVLLFGGRPAYERGGESFGAVDPTHRGRANLGTVDGAVSAAAPENLREYFVPQTMNKPLRHESVPLRLYLDGGKAEVLK